MSIRVTSKTTSKFSSDESGALLVFFALCAAIIFLVAALSFDLGRRSSTQTEIQAFVDNVALAAAGELNGKAGAIQRARNAANDLITDSFVIGEGDRTLSGLGDFHIYFYEELPPNDADPLVGELEQIPDNDGRARFVRVAMIDDPAKGGDRRVQVPWVFARLLSIFSTDPLPDDKVGAEAVAGWVSLACDVAPVFFCKPPAEVDPDTGEISEWDPANHIGEAIRLRSGGQGASNGGYWEPGNFTWLDVREQVPESVVDAGGPCAGLSGNNLYECLFAAEDGITLCFENGDLVTLPGQKEGNVAAVFDTRFDIYSSSSSQVADDPIYRPAPVVTKAYEADGVCGASQTATDTTMALPHDDCFIDDTCAEYSGTQRYGDGTWSQGRLQYVQQNYSMDAATAGQPYNPADILQGGDIVTVGGVEYHKADPFRPDPDDTDYSQAEIDAAAVPGISGVSDMTREAILNPPGVPGNEKYPFDSFPVVPAGESRWNYYQAEVAASLYNDPSTVFYQQDGTWVYDDFGADPVPGGPRELIRDIPGVYDRLGASLPYCSQENNPGNFSPSPRRRTLVAAVVDCEEEQIAGKTTDVTADFFVEVFLIAPSDEDPEDNKKKEIFVEIIDDLSDGTSSTAPGRFRDFVQLYR